MAYMLRLNPSGDQFSLPHNVDVSDALERIEEAIAEGGAARVEYVLRDMPDATGTLIINGRATASAEIVELPDEVELFTRGLTPIVPQPIAPLQG